jgi:hypothetical protein
MGGPAMNSLACTAYWAGVRERARASPARRAGSAANPRWGLPHETPGLRACARRGAFPSRQHAGQAQRPTASGDFRSKTPDLRPQGRAGVSPARRVGSAADGGWGLRYEHSGPADAEARSRLASTPRRLSGLPPVGLPHETPNPPAIPYEAPGPARAGARSRLAGTPDRSTQRPTAGGRRMGGCWRLGVKLTTVTGFDRLGKTPASRQDTVGGGKEAPGAKAAGAGKCHTSTPDPHISANRHPWARDPIDGRGPPPAPPPSPGQPRTAEASSAQDRPTATGPPSCPGTSLPTRSPPADPPSSCRSPHQGLAAEPTRRAGETRTRPCARRPGVLLRKSPLSVRR